MFLSYRIDCLLQFPKSLNFKPNSSHYTHDYRNTLLFETKKIHNLKKHARSNEAIKVYIANLTSYFGRVLTHLNTVSCFQVALCIIAVLISLTLFNPVSFSRVSTCDNLLLPTVLPPCSFYPRVFINFDTSSS